MLRLGIWSRGLEGEKLEFSGGWSHTVGGSFGGDGLGGEDLQFLG